MYPRCLALALLLVCIPASGGAQGNPGSTVPDTAAARRAIEQRVGRSVSHAEILERLRDSGMSRSEVRTRVQQMGLDPRLADQYFDMIESGETAPAGDASSDLVDALRRAGLNMDARRVLDEQERERAALLADTTKPSEVFGIATFRRAGTQFQPLLTGPVDAGYRLGPGDELVLVLTGDVEETHTLPVTREGHIFIPDVGQVSVNGLTLGQLEDMLYGRLASVYSGVSRSPNAPTRFQVSIAQLRTNQIFVRGEVAIPGAFQVSSVGSLFTALYQAGGPTEAGSFRAIELHRGGQRLRTVDLYSFLIGGESFQDIRLEHNDHIFVPPAGTQVRVEGSVRRPAIYEMKPGEGVRELLVFAGGLRADAMMRRVQIDRILPPQEQQPGRYREVVDVDAGDIARGVPLQDGDVVVVFGVTDTRRNRIMLTGDVYNPGLYEWRPGMTLWELLRRADGPSETAYMSRAQVYRLIESEGTRSLLPVSLERAADGTPVADLQLMDADSVVVLSRRELRTDENVWVDGYVKNAGTYPLAQGMTLRDLILTAGGFTEGAYVLEAEISRQPDPLTRTDVTAHVIRVPLRAPPANAADVPDWAPELNEVVLQHGDRVFVRRAPGWSDIRQVQVSGQVLIPGSYVLATRSERLMDVLQRAGGLTPQAYSEGMHVVRGGRVVAGNLQRALNDPTDANNIILLDGDSIHVPEYDPTVLVTGAVTFEARVLFRPGRSLDYYIEQAGGYTDRAEKSRVTVSYANGERSAVGRRVLGFGGPEIRPGSQIFVPAEPEGGPGINWERIITLTTATLGTIATLLIAVNQVK